MDGWMDGDGAISKKIAYLLTTSSPHTIAESSNRDDDDEDESQNILR